MAGTQITLDHSTHDVLEVLDKLLHQTSDLEPAMMEISEYLHERTRYHFDHEEGPGLPRTRSVFIKIRYERSIYGVEAL